MKDELKSLIESVYNGIVLEQNIPKRELAIEYVNSIKKKSPSLYRFLLKQALFSLKAVKNDIKPRYTHDKLKRLLKVDADADPTKSADTHGVRLFIDYLIEDPTVASKVKRFYQQSLDNLLRHLYEKDRYKK